MNTATNPRIKSLSATPNTPKAADPAAARTTGGVPKVVAEGVPVAVRSDSHPGDGRSPVTWLSVVAPPSYSATASARSWCQCGYERTARGRSGVLALIKAHTEHRNLCPLLDSVEGSKAA
ncbi:hypothetical protein [Streptomyces sp. DT171]|uniref:hypothetical protein n=1 Tax=Streptomyces sp. DT171 TaxID=3416524 RepID=UPI003CF53AB5